MPWLGLSLLIILLDYLSKQWALDTLTMHSPVPVIEGFWQWTLTFNYGAAFSFLSEHGGWQRWLFSGLAIVLSALMTYMLSRTGRGDWKQALPLALIIGGAIGNLIDRIRYGYVVDFVDWYWRDYHWPAFNVADSAIVAGAIGLAVFGFVGGEQEKK
nr:signal peptidase II [Pseudomarimonas arenosa]